MVMAQAEMNIDLREIVLSNQSFGPQDVERIANAIADDMTQFALLRDAVNELQASENLSPATMTRLGICQVLIGKFSEAESTLRQGDGGALAQYYLGKVYFQRGELEKAISYYEAAEKSGYTQEVCNIAKAEALRYQGQLENAMKSARQHFWSGRTNSRVFVSTWCYSCSNFWKPRRSRQTVSTCDSSQPKARGCTIRSSTYV